MSLNWLKHSTCPFTDKQVAHFIERLVETENGCFCWTGQMVGEYGAIALSGMQTTAHKASFLMFNGPVPKGLIIRHTCDNPPCCNPSHLILGTHKQNSQDMLDRKRGNPPRGERAWNHVLTRQKVMAIKTDLVNGALSQLELSRLHGVAKSTINAIREGKSWAHVPPFISKVIPQPHRIYSDSDYTQMREMWRDGSTLKQIADKYGARIDTIQAILRGKRGKNVPLILVESRQNKSKLSDETWAAIIARNKAGETKKALSVEFGMSYSGLRYALERMAS